jgi:hypothetical protein
MDKNMTEPTEWLKTTPGTKVTFLNDGTILHDDKPVTFAGVTIPDHLRVNIPSVEYTWWCKGVLAARDTFKGNDDDAAT